MYEILRINTQGDSFYSYERARAHYVEQAGLKFKITYMPLPAECWD